MKGLFFSKNKNLKKYDTSEYLQDVAIDYRNKSIQSVRLKYDRYYPDHQAAKVFNDMLGFRTLRDDYENVLRMEMCEHIRVVNMSNGKSNDDGYKYIYKRGYSNCVGCILCQTYENAKIKNEREFKEALEDVLSGSKKI